MAAPLRVRIAVFEDAQPIVDALARLHLDLGSVRAASVHSVGAFSIDSRYLCVALADLTEVDPFAQRLRDDLLQHLPLDAARAAIKLTDRCAITPLPLDAVLVVFLDVAAVEASL